MRDNTTSFHGMLTTPSKPKFGTGDAKSGTSPKHGSVPSPSLCESPSPTMCEPTTNGPLVNGESNSRNEANPDPDHSFMPSKFPLMSSDSTRRTPSPYAIPTPQQFGDRPSSFLNGDASTEEKLTLQANRKRLVQRTFQPNTRRNVSEDSLAIVPEPCSSSSHKHLNDDCSKGRSNRTIDTKFSNNRCDTNKKVCSTHIELSVPRTKESTPSPVGAIFTSELSLKNFPSLPQQKSIFSEHEPQLPRPLESHQRDRRGSNAVFGGLQSLCFPPAPSLGHDHISTTASGLGRIEDRFETSLTESLRIRAPSTVGNVTGLAEIDKIVRNVVEELVNNVARNVVTQDLCRHPVETNLTNSVKTEKLTNSQPHVSSRVDNDSGFLSDTPFLNDSDVRKYSNSLSKSETTTDQVLPTSLLLHVSAPNLGNFLNASSMVTSSVVNSVRTSSTPTSSRKLLIQNDPTKKNSPINVPTFDSLRSSAKLLPPSTFSSSPARKTSSPVTYLKSRGTKHSVPETPGETVERIINQVLSETPGSVRQQTQFGSKSGFTDKYSPSQRSCPAKNFSHQQHQCDSGAPKCTVSTIRATTASIPKGTVSMPITRASEPIQVWRDPDLLRKDDELQRQLKARRQVPSITPRAGLGSPPLIATGTTPNGAGYHSRSNLSTPSSDGHPIVSPTQPASDPRSPYS